MSTNVKKEVQSVQTSEQLEEVIAEYKKRNPVKAALKEANGDFDRQRTLLGAKKKEVEEKAAEPGKSVLSKSELKTLAEEKGLELNGSERKSELLKLLQLE